MNYFEAKVAAERHKRQEHPTAATHKRGFAQLSDDRPEDEHRTHQLSNGVVLDLYLRPAAFIATLFQCEGCGWSVAEERRPVPPCSTCGGTWFLMTGMCFDCLMVWWDDRHKRARKKS